MPKAEESLEEARLLLGLLESVDQNSARSQRMLAAECGVALGLVNAYLKRCIRKGLVKVKATPARRYAYFLTPRGFAEKSRLTLAYLDRSMTFFREARKDCATTCQLSRKRGWSRIALAGRSDLAEIAAICSLEAHIMVAAVIDPRPGESQFIGATVFESFEAVNVPFDGVLVTDLTAPQETFAAAVRVLGPDRVLAPQLLGIAPVHPGIAP